MVINCVTRPGKDNFETTLWEMAQCSIITLKKAVYKIGCEATSMPMLKQRNKE